MMAKPEKDVFDKIFQLLKRLQDVKELKHVTERIFQREPTISAKIFEKVDMLSKTKRKSALLTELLDKIKFFTRNVDTSRDLGLPRKGRDYLKYIDLLVLIRRSSAKTWKVFHLQNYVHSTECDDLALHEAGIQMRYKLKSSLAKLGYVSSIQTEVDGNKVWFSVSHTRKTNNKEKDKQRLVKSNYKYLAYVPSESYFYVGGCTLPTELGDAFADCTGSTKYTSIPLEGRYLDSLRQMRLNRESGKAKSDLDINSHDRFSTLKHQGVQPQKVDYPLLDRYRIDCPATIKNLDNLQNKNRLSGTKVTIRMECRGKDVIGGLHDMVSADMIRAPPPRWVTNLATSGRNRVNLVPTVRKESDNELQSLLSTASTVRRK